MKKVDMLRAAAAIVRRMVMSHLLEMKNILNFG